MLSEITVLLKYSHKNEFLGVLRLAWKVEARQKKYLKGNNGKENGKVQKSAQLRVSKGAFVLVSTARRAVSANKKTNKGYKAL